MLAIVSIPTQAIPEGSTPTYTANLVDSFGDPVPAQDLNTLTLTICDTLSGEIINSCDQENILNGGRGTITPEGLLTIQLLTGDTSMSELAANVVQIQRSLIIDWTYDGGAKTGRHQANFPITRLAGP